MKRSIILVQLGLVACLGLTTLGCVGEDPLDDRDYVKDDDCDDGKCDDDDDDESSREKMAAPLVDDLEKNTACEKVIPVRGKTKPNTMVFVKGGKGDSLERSDEDGTFCVPVTLNDGENTLVVYAHDKYGNESQPSEELEVTQEGDCSDEYEETAEEEDEPKIGDVTSQAFNLKKIDDQVIPGGDIGKQQGDFEDLFDGRVSTGVKLGTDQLSLDRPIWVHFKLNEPQVADAAEVTVEFSEKEETGGEAYGKDYTVLWSAEDDPGDPQPSETTHWLPIRWERKGEGGPDTFTVSAESNKKIRHLALYLKDSATSWTENYAIGELRLRARQYAPARSSKPESRVCD